MSQIEKVKKVETLLKEKEIPKFLTKNKADAFIKLYSNPKHRLIVVLGIDAGLRVSEIARLKVGNVDFKKRMITIKSLKKRESKNDFRSIPMTNRLIKTFSEYWHELKSVEKESFIFPSESAKSGHINRVSINKIIKRKDASINPHMLRHTFATRILAESKDIYTLQKLLGHKSIATTEVYSHIEESELIKAVQAIEHKKRNWFGKVIKPKTENFIVHVERGRNKFIIGRIKELSWINERVLKRINILITGKDGLGKTQMLENLNYEKILRIDEGKIDKKVLVAMLMHLYEGDKEKIGNLLFQDGEVMKRLQHETINSMCDLMIEATEEKEYSLIIDDANLLTAKSLTILKKLKNHFHIVAAAEEIKFKNAHFFTNFDKLELTELKRKEALKLIDKLSKPHHNQIQNYNHYRNHIYNQTNGNPKYISEMIDRLSKESFIDTDTTMSVTHVTALRDIDMTMPIIILLSCLSILRYMGTETGEGSYRFLGSIFMLVLFFGRSLGRIGKRKTL